MKISSQIKNINNKTNMQSFRAIPTNPIFMPEVLGKLGKAVGEYVSVPEQKLLLATSALMFHPLIDLKYADEDKRTDAAIKSASKAIAGGITGVTIRAAFIKFTNKYIGFDKQNPFNRLYFYPTKASELRDLKPTLADLRMKQYTATLGTIFALLFMSFFSNSKVDVPLTSDFQDFISGITKENKTWSKSLNDTYQARKTKIINWFMVKKKYIDKIANKGKKIINVIADKDNNENSTKKEIKK